MISGNNKTQTPYSYFIDSVLIICLFCISLCIHLFTINFPETVVADEYQSKENINCYCNGTFFFDTNPPLGKIVIFQLSKIFKYRCNVINKKLPLGDFIPIRFGVAVISSFAPCFVYGCIRLSGISRLPAATSAFMMVFETSLIVEGRFVIVDGILITFVCLHLLVITLDLGNYTPFVMGATLGLCISTKFSAFSLIPYSIFVLFRKFNWVSHVVMVLVALSVLIIFTIAHLSFLPDPSEDVSEYLPVSLQYHLFVDRDPSKFVWDSIQLIWRQIKINTKNLHQFHPYQSTPASWPLLTGIWVQFWDIKSTKIIACLGNPAVYWTGAVSIALLFTVFPKLSRTAATSASIGWAVSYLPFFLMRSTMFLYNYQIPLVFAIISFAPMIERVVKINQKKTNICLALIAVCAVSFIYWSPFVYGYSVPNLKRRVWLPIWARGTKKHRQSVEEFYGLNM